MEGMGVVGEMERGTGSRRVGVVVKGRMGEEAGMVLARTGSEGAWRTWRAVEESRMQGGKRGGGMAEVGRAAGREGLVRPRFWWGEVGGGGVRLGPDLSRGSGRRHR